MHASAVSAHLKMLHKFVFSTPAVAARSVLPGLGCARYYRRSSSKKKMPKVLSADEAMKRVKSGDKIFVHGMSCTPQKLLKALVKRAPELRDVELHHLHTHGEAEYTKPGMEESFRLNAFFVHGNTRKAVQDGRASYIPVFLHEIPRLFTQGIIDLDVALMQVSPPDKHGFCSLGPSVDVAVTAIHEARHVIAQVNPHMPRTHGDGILHVSSLDSIVEVNEQLPLLPRKTEDDFTFEEMAIGENIAELIPDGACLQMGIGNIPDATLKALANHRNLGVHTEMFSDGVVDLMESGVITNTEKTIERNHIVSGFSMGSQRVYDFMHDNPLVKMLDIAFINNPSNIKQNSKVCAINSAIEIDLTGQVCADSIGSKIFSGVGGQMDFLRGAALSPGGKPILAVPSQTAKGQSKLVPFLKPGAGVVTTRAHVHYVVTEHGVAHLHGKTIRERQKEMVRVAHPAHRDMLNKFLRESFWREPLNWMIKWMDYCDTPLSISSPNGVLDEKREEDPPKVPSPKVEEPPKKAPKAAAAK